MIKFSVHGKEVSGITLLDKKKCIKNLRKLVGQKRLQYDPELGYHYILITDKLVNMMIKEIEELKIGDNK